MTSHLRCSQEYISSHQSTFNQQSHHQQATDSSQSPQQDPQSSPRLAATQQPPNQRPRANIRFKCLTCDIYVCKVCAEICHRLKDHQVVFHGRTDFQCACSSPSTSSDSPTATSSPTPTHNDDISQQNQNNSPQTAHVSTCCARSHWPQRNDSTKVSQSASAAAAEPNYSPLLLYDPLMRRALDTSSNHSLSDSTTLSQQRTEWCTYMLTATYHTFQILYPCRTCHKANHQHTNLATHSEHHDSSWSNSSLDASANSPVMVCSLCKDTCHAGHDVDEEGVLLQALCDCGAGNCITSSTKMREYLNSSQSHPATDPNVRHRHHTHSSSSYVQPDYIESSGRINCLNILPKVRISAPPKTGQHVCSIDGDSLIVFAGAFEYVSNDMYEFNFASSSWFRITQQGDVPGIRSAHSGCKHQGFMYIFGGVCGSERYSTVLRFDFSSYRWKKLDTTGQVPQARYFTCLAPYQDSLYCVGGMLDDNRGDNALYRLNLRTNVWSRIPTSGIPLPSINGMSAVVHDDTLLLFGGYSHGASKFSNALYSFNFNTSTWTKVSTVGEIPHRRAYHTAILGGRGTKYQHSMFVFGGKCPISLEKDRQASHEKETLYEYKIKDNIWVKLKPNQEIENVFFHQAVEHNNCLYFFGGNDRKSFCYSFYCYNLDTQSWSTVNAASVSASNIRRDFLNLLLEDPMCSDLIIELSNGEKLLTHTFVLCRTKALSDLFLKGKEQDKAATGSVDTVAKVSDSNPLEATTQDSSEEGPRTLFSQSSDSSDEKDEGTDSKLLFIPEEPHHVKLSSDEDAQVFQQIVFFLYGSDHLILQQQDFLLKLMKRARELELYGLVEKGSRAMDRFITQDSVISLLSEAHSHSLQSLKNKCISFISRNYDDLIHSSEMATLEPTVLLEVARSKGSNFKLSEDPSTRYSPLAETFLLNHLRELEKSKEFADIVLISSDHVRVKAHRALLAAQCEFFRNLFSGHFVESQETSIEIDIPKLILDVILHFFYTGELRIGEDSTQNLQMIMEVAHYSDWMVFESLERVCQDKLMELINGDNIWEVLRLSSIHQGHKFVHLIKQRAMEEFKKTEKDDLIEMFVDFACNMDDYVPRSVAISRDQTSSTGSESSVETRNAEGEESSVQDS